jgi:hypothetical protein
VSEITDGAYGQVFAKLLWPELPLRPLCEGIGILFLAYFGETAGSDKALAKPGFTRMMRPIRPGSRTSRIEKSCDSICISLVLKEMMSTSSVTRLREDAHR